MLRYQSPVLLVVNVLVLIQEGAYWPLRHLGPGDKDAAHQVCCTGSSVGAP